MKIPLDGGFYKAASIIAGAQRCLNLYPEKNQGDAPFPFTHYLTPGLSVVASGPNAQVRCVYTDSTGLPWVVIGTTVYYIDTAFALHSIGDIGTFTGQVAMADNRLCLVIVDGSSSGWCVDLTTKTLQRIVSDAFYGSVNVKYLDTFFVFVKPNSNLWYISLSEVTAANLTGGPIIDLSITTGGSSYPNGIFIGLPLTGGSGDSALADVTVSGGVVTGLAIGVGGENYRAGEVVSVANGSFGGEPSAGTIIGGTGYTNGTYAATALSGGSGTAAQATVVVAGGIVTTVTFSAGTGYLVGDILTLAAGALGGGTGFSYTVTSVTGTGTGFTATVTTVGSSGFDPLDFATITGDANNISNFGIVNRQLWFVGTQNYGEIWINLGTPDFTFGRQAGVALQHGSSAIYSLAQWDIALFWLGDDDAGNKQVYRGQDYQATIISPPAISAAISGYADVSDAIGFIYQQKGHVFYVLTFPSADATWVFDIGEKLWHEWAYTPDGNEHRHRSNCHAFAYGKNIVGDYENGSLYALTFGAGGDAGTTIDRRRGFPHLVSNSNRISVSRFIADMDVGQTAGTTTDAPPEVSMRASITKGASWGNPRVQSLGSAGQYATNVQFRQLGMGRDWVFELFWSGDAITALNGAYLEAVEAKT